MHPSRRAVLSGLAALGACGPRPEPGDGPAGEPPAPWAPEGRVDLARFPSGVRAGDALPDGVVVSARTAAPAVTWLLARGDAGGWGPPRRVAGPAPVRGVAEVVLDGLAPDTTYAVVAAAADGGRSTPARFRTALAPGGRRRVRFAATCCLGADADPWPSMRRATEQGPLDAFLLLGDTIYVDVRARPARTYAARWDRALATDGLQAAGAATSLVAAWDDHEVANDWTWAADRPLVRPALRAFRDALPQRRGPGGLGTWRRLTWGEVVDVFVLDARSERGPGRLVSEEQLGWLLAGLRDSRAACKLVAGGVPVTDLSGLYLRSEEQGWLPFAQRDALLAATAAIPGVVWLGGDVHWGGIGRVGRQREVLCGPAGSKVTTEAETAIGDPRFDEVVLAHNTVLLDVDPDAAALTVTFVGADGPLVRRTIAL